METDIIEAAPEDTEAVPETDVTENEDAASDTPADTSSGDGTPEADDAAPETDTSSEESDGEPERETSVDSSVSGNSAGENGSTVVFPEGFEYSGMSSEDAAVLVEALEYQTKVIYSGFIGLAIMVGVTAGILFIYGFRLRRV